MRSLLVVALVGALALTAHAAGGGGDDPTIKLENVHDLSECGTICVGFSTARRDVCGLARVFLRNCNAMEPLRMTLAGLSRSRELRCVTAQTRRLVATTSARSLISGCTRGRDTESVKRNWRAC